MLTLSDASKDTKQIIKWGLITIVSLVILITLFRAFLYIKEQLFPTPPPKPTATFGKLPQINFPINTANALISYSIDTLSGELPSFPDQTKVFRMQTAQPDLLAMQKATEKVAKLGFTTPPIAASDTTFQWTTSENSLSLKKSINFDITNNNFSLTSDYLTNQTVLDAKNLPDQFQAIDQAKAALSEMNLLTDDINIEKVRTNLFSITNGTLTPATSISKTQIVKVDFPQKNINKLPIYYQKPNSANISFLIAGGENQSQIAQVNYIHQVTSETYATYPLKTASLAYAELKKDKAYIASHNGSNNVAIKNVFLAYYIDSKTQDFLMPIIVFTGDNEFIAYVSALTDEWINK